MKRNMLCMSLVLVFILFTSCEEYGSTPVEQLQPSAIDKNQPENIISGKGESSMGSQAAQNNFRTHLSGDEEVDPVDTRAQGQAIFQVSEDGESISYKLIVANIEDVRMAHIHLAPAGENGDIVVWLYPPAPPPQLIEGRSNGVLAEGSFTADNLTGPLEGESLGALIEAINSGNTYVNVHTEANPGGEIRGQI